MERQEDGHLLRHSFFINNYQLTTFSVESQVLQLFCIQSASTDYDLTGQLVIELGSGIGVMGILCSRFCHEVLMTDYNYEVLKILRENIKFHTSSERPSTAILAAEKLEWGNSDDCSKPYKDILWPKILDDV